MSVCPYMAVLNVALCMLPLVPPVHREHYFSFYATGLNCRETTTHLAHLDERICGGRVEPLHCNGDPQVALLPGHRNITIEKTGKSVYWALFVPNKILSPLVYIIPIQRTKEIFQVVKGSEGKQMTAACKKRFYQ